MQTVLLNNCLGHWAETEGGTATLVNLSENHTFRIDLSSGERFMLRVHRPGYQSPAAIRSELEWISALRADTALPVPRPLPGRDGRLVQNLIVPGEAPRHAVLFAFQPGREPRAEDDLGGLFETLGRFAAIAHAQASNFALAVGFTRPAWNAGAILNADGLWGDWRKAPLVEGQVLSTLAALEGRLRSELARYGEGRGRFGLIHADMRLANLLVDGDRVTLIDFDDCGFGWFMYDFAAAISFYEDQPQVGGLRQRWLAGYTAIRALDAKDLDIIDTMVLLRRMALLAWIGSHGETELAKAHAGDFAETTAALAAPYLAGTRLES